MLSRKVEISQSALSFCATDAMKLIVLDINGNKIKETESNIFDSQIREDIVQKIAEVEKEKQPYAPYIWAGMETSASGNVKHNRHVWKSDRGKGLSRYPKKKMSRSGDRFVWVGAVIPGVRGGRRAHPPKLGGRIRKINRKEYIIGLKSALAMIASAELVKKKYKSLEQKELGINLPIIVDSKILALKTKEFLSALKRILGNANEIAFQKKIIRAGIGKMRGRKYKKSAGIILVIGNEEEKKMKEVEIRKADELAIGDLTSNGARLTIFTERAVKDIEERLKIGGKNK